MLREVGFEPTMYVLLKHYHLKVAVTVFILYIYYIIFFYKNQIVILVGRKGVEPLSYGS